MRLDLSDLRLFLNVVEAGSLTAGAARAHLALASVSARIRDMEAEIGTPLLERSRAGVAATPAGEALVHHARLMLAQSERMRGELAGYGKGLKGHVRLWCNTASFGHGLSADLARFLVANPSIDMDLEERPSGQIAQALVEGLIHMGITSDAADTSGLQLTRYREDRLVVALPRDHPLCERASLRIADVLEEPFVGLPEGNGLQSLVERNAVRAGGALKYRVRVNGFAAMATMVGPHIEAHVGIAVIPAAVAQQLRESHALVFVPLDEPWARRTLVIAVRREDVLPAYARRLLAYLRAPSE